MIMTSHDTINISLLVICWARVEKKKEFARCRWNKLHALWSRMLTMHATEMLLILDVLRNVS